MNKLRNAFGCWPGTVVLPGSVLRDETAVSKTTIRRWLRRGWIAYKGRYVITLDGYRAMT